MADRETRIRIFEETAALCGSHPLLSERVERSVREQSIVWQEDPIAEGRPRFAVPAETILSPHRTLEAARKYARTGKRTCVLNFASSVTPGGSVKRGGGAQEESICRISTLYPAIGDGATAAPFYERHRSMIRSGEMGRENRDDCIYTPGVTVIREDTYECELLPEPEWYCVDVITCAAPDLRFDGNGKTFSPTEEELVRVFERRWRRILSVAARHEADALILGAFGCGVFRNPPELVARAFSHVMEEFRYCFETIEFAVHSKDGQSPNYAGLRGIRGIRESGGQPGEEEDRADAAAGSEPRAEPAISWNKLLRLVDAFNRRIKEPGWRYEDKQEVYRLKDLMLKRLLTGKPSCVGMRLWYVPYFRYSQETKDRAGDLMRRDRNQFDFEYYLSQVPPSEGDREDPNKAMVELQAVCLGDSFSFHMPLRLAEECGVDPAALPRRPWIDAPEFHHGILAEAAPVIRALLDAVAG